MVKPEKIIPLYKKSKFANSSKSVSTKILFEEILLKEINLMREKPFEYADKLESLIKYIIPIKTDIGYKRSSNKYIFAYPNAEKVGLSTGKKAFKDAIFYLRTLNPMRKLTMNSKIKLNFDECETFNNYFLQNIIFNKRRVLKDEYPSFNVNLDVISDPIVSAVVHLVDDNPFQGRMREIILNEKFSEFAATQFKDKSKNKNFSLICFA